MDSTELATLIEELDERVERLRALYEQYFMGIERIEPLILRKDVERRLWMLRREQIRNTATRFLLQGVISRYNSYQQYWARVCRDIENGTFTRDLKRAAERFGAAAALTVVGRKRQTMIEKGLAKRAEREGDRRDRAEASSHGSDDPMAPQDQDRAALQQVAGKALDRVALGSARPTAATATGANGGGADQGPALRPSTTSRPPPSQPATSRPPRPPAVEFSPLDLDMGGDDLAPAPRRFAPPPPARASQPPKAPLPSAPPQQELPQAAASRAPPASPPATPVRVAPPPAPARPPARPPSPGLANSTAAPAGGPGGLSEQRLRELYGQYADAKRKQEQPVGLTFERMAANLRDSERKLRAQHEGRAVDFEVIIKSGATVLRPIIRARKP